MANVHLYAKITRASWLPAFLWIMSKVWRLFPSLNSSTRHMIFVAWVVRKGTKIEIVEEAA